MEECMLLEGNVRIHGIYTMIAAAPFVAVRICTFKIVKQPMIIGAVSEPIMFIPLDRQLRQMDSETRPGWD